MGIETKKVCLGKRINVYEGKRARLGRGSGSLWYKPERHGEHGGALHEGVVESPACRPLVLLVTYHKSNDVRA